MLEQQECWNGEGEGHGEQVLYIQGEQVCLKMGTSPGSSQALLTRVCGMDLCKADPSPLSINTDTVLCCAVLPLVVRLHTCLPAEVGDTNPTQAPHFSVSYH